MALTVRRNLTIVRSAETANVRRRFRFGKVLAERAHVCPLPTGGCLQFFAFGGQILTISTEQQACRATASDTLPIRKRLKPFRP